MKSFQNKDGKTCKASLNKCIHQNSKHSLSQPKTQQPAQEYHPVQMEEDPKGISQFPKRSQTSDPFKENLKLLIAQNEAYFRNKLNAADNGRPNNLKLKIPSKTGGTTYHKDFQNGLSSNSSYMRASQDRFIPQNTPKNNNFFDETTYKTEFVPHKELARIIHKKQSQTIDADAPKFLETQYKNTFLNWGGNNNVPSMKPSHRPAVTNLPLQSQSAYSLDFTQKTHIPVQSFKPIIGAQSNKQNKNSPSNGLTYVTTSKLHFDSKKLEKQQSLKPKTQTLKVSGCHFKGRTEYQNQFISGQQKCVEEKHASTLQELQNLMLGQ